MIKLLVLDVDGCLTNGNITYTTDGAEIKSFSVKDGFGIECWHRLGRKSAIITGRDSTITTKRAKELGITHLYQGVRDKGVILKEIMEKESITKDEIAAIGDDLNDLKMFAFAGVTFAPNDANEKLKECATIKLSKNGGDGVVREMIEYILKSEGEIESFYNLWR